MLRSRLTPNLLSFVASTLEEIEYGLDAEFPLDRGIGPILANRILADDSDNGTCNRSVDDTENQP